MTDDATALHITTADGQQTANTITPRILSTTVRSGLQLMHLRLAHFSERKILESMKYGAILSDENSTLERSDDKILQRRLQLVDGSLV